MGRRIWWLKYYLKRLLQLAAAIWLAMWAMDYVNTHYGEDVEERARTAILPRVVEVDLRGVEQFLGQPKQTTLIFFYNSDNMLSRWYFGDFNKMAAKYGPQGVRLLFVSVDDQPMNLATFLASQGDLYFVPTFMGGADAAKFPGLIRKLGGDPFGGTLPYMGVMNAVGYIRDFSPAIIRTGKIDEVLDDALLGR